VGEPDIVRHLGERIITDAVPELVEQALRNGGPRCDNVTALAVEWEGEDEPEETISTQHLSDEGFASTIQTAGAEGQLDEDEIERTVREIRETIVQRARKNS
jgi:hypothetical protein